MSLTDAQVLGLDVSEVDQSAIDVYELGYEVEGDDWDLLEHGFGRVPVLENVDGWYQPVPATFV